MSHRLPCHLFSVFFTPLHCSLSNINFLSLIAETLHFSAPRRKKLINRRLEAAAMEGGLHINGGGLAGAAAAWMTKKKRVMVVVDESARARHALIWALTHVANKGDLLTLLHVIPPYQESSPFFSPCLASSLGSLCKISRPEVEVEILVIQGPKLDTVTSQVKKLEVSVLVLGQKKPSTSFLNCLCGMSGSDEFVKQCIDGADCLTIGVRKQSRGMGGYLITTRWQKNFWLLA